MIYTKDYRKDYLIMKLTIFTPTYNRLAQLPGLYKSIRKSLSHIKAKDEVEWIIVDDGSDIDICECVNGFQIVDNLSIKQIKKENGGKHTAFNVAIEHAKSDIFVCIDDDDRLTENALSDIFDLAKKYRNNQYGGIVGRVVNQDGELLGETTFEDVLISNTIEIRDKYNFWGEPEVFYTDILKLYRFDVFNDERFLTEAYLFDRMSLEYPFVYTNVALMVKQYLPDGLTDNQLRIRVQNPVGCEAYYYQRKTLCNGFKNKLRATINRRRFCRYSENKPNRPIDIYEIIAIPFSWMMALIDKRNTLSGMKNSTHNNS